MKASPRWLPTVPRARRSRLLALAGLAVAVLATHLGLLRQRTAPRPVARVTVTPPRPAASATPTEPMRRPAPATPTPDDAAAAARPRPAASAPTADAARRPPAQTPQVLTARPAPLTPAVDPATASPEAGAATASPSPSPNPRVAFACTAADHAALPPPVDLRYSLQRGRLRGEGLLSWRHDAQHYRLSLEAQLPPTGTLLRQTSEGGFDRCGLAPLRHTDKRLGRSERALSVLRPPTGSPAADAGEAGELRFSGRSVARALDPGTQDRLSWLMQLTLRLSQPPNPSQADATAPGAPIEIAVASVGGDVQHWVFTPLGRDADGLLHLRREPDGPYETHAEVWVDPLRGHWPVRILLTEPRGEPLLLQLVDGRPTAPR